MMKTVDNLFFNNLNLLQAINDWQINSTTKRGNKLKKLCETLPIKYRQSSSKCYRKIDLEGEFVWDLVAENLLKEKISSWSTDVNIVKSFKGGVPSQKGEYTGVILAIKPPSNSIILNLEELYESKDFQNALIANKDKIKHYEHGCGKYNNSQKEVILEIESVSSDEIYSLGGYTSIIIPGIIDKPVANWLTYAGTQKILDRLYSGKYKENYK